MKISGSVVAMMLGAACVQQGPAQQQTTPTHQTGQIRGTVRFRGNAPATHTEMNSKTPEVCGHEIPVTRLQLSEGNGVRHAFVYLEGIESSESLRPTASLTIEQRGCAYAPHSMVMTAGAPLEIVNDDPVLHNVRASSLSEDGPQTVFNIAQPVRGQRTKIESQLKPGIMTLTCEAGHPWMTAHMLVTDHDFVAVTDELGRFVIDNVPVGSHPIKMWHEGVSLTRIIASLQQFEYEAPYEITKQVVVRPGATSDVEFELELRQRIN